MIEVSLEEAIEDKVPDAQPGKGDKVEKLFHMCEFVRGS